MGIGAALEAAETLALAAGAVVGLGAAEEMDRLVEKTVRNKTELVQSHSVDRYLGS